MGKIRTKGSSVPPLSDPPERRQYGRALEVLERLGLMASLMTNDDIMRVAHERREANFRRLGLPVDPRGRWTERQAKEVLAVIGPEALKHHVAFEAIDTTTRNYHVVHVFVLVPRCTKHDKPLIGWECLRCTREQERHAQWELSSHSSQS